jgi:curved DNA-binding protein CbpA
VRGSYYDVLGVAQSSTDEHIRHRYLQLMRRYHPDRNDSPLAQARSAEITEAYRHLSNATLRAGHNARLRARRQDVVTATALSYSGGHRGSALVRRRRPSPLKRYAAGLAFVALLVGTGVVGWGIEQRLPRVDAGPLLAPDRRDDENRRAVAMIVAASAAEAQAMPALSIGAVRKGAVAFRRLNRETPGKARAYSELCHAKAAYDGGWNALDFCAAFDEAAFRKLAAGDATSSEAAYFIDQHDRAGHAYIYKVSNMDAIEDRLNRIKVLVTTSQPRQRTGVDRILHGISKRGSNIADAAWKALSSQPSAPRSKHDAHDF